MEKLLVSRKKVLVYPYYGIILEKCYSQHIFYRNVFSL